MAEADTLPYDEKGAWPPRKGLYAGQLSTWRKNLAEHGEAGVAARQPGRKPADPRDKELERLRKANACLEKRAKDRDLFNLCNLCNLWMISRSFMVFHLRKSAKSAVSNIMTFGRG